MAAMGAFTGLVSSLPSPLPDLRLEDPETKAAYVVVKDEVYRQLTGTIEDSDFTLHEFEEFIPAE